MADQPFDLDACLAEGDEAREPFPFTFGGEEFVLPHPDDVGITALNALNEGNSAKGLRLLLGEDQWGRLDGLDAAFTASAFRRLAEAWKGHYAVDLGE
jgi:hypothetical protein